MKTVLVTLADSGYLDAARQLFSSAHFAGGWQGDYLLLTSDVPSEGVRDFLDKGIHVRPVEPVCDDSIPKKYRAMLGKIELFKTFFKQWDRVVYLDGDIIIRAGLPADLLKPTFGAVRDLLSLKTQLEPPARSKIRKNRKTFNAGMLSFDTSILHEDTHSRILEGVLSEWRNMELVDQPALNVVFQEVWTPLSLDYNVQANVPVFGRVWPEHFRGTVIHFTTRPKPWENDTPVKQEWESNLKRFSGMDLNSRHEGFHWTPRQVLTNSLIQHVRFVLGLADVKVGETAAAARTFLRTRFHRNP